MIEHLEEILFTVEGKKRIEEKRKHLPKARGAFIYGFGWPSSHSHGHNQTFQIGVSKTEKLYKGEAVYSPVYGEWSENIAPFETGGKTL